MKKTHVLIVILLLSAMLLTSCRVARRFINAAVNAATPVTSMTKPQTGVIIETLDVPYKSMAGMDANLISLDIYWTKPGNGLPVMIYVHGGAWSLGDKSNVELKDDFFLQSGFVFVSVNYRLSPDAEFPQHVEDVVSAIAWVHLNIAQYGGDPNEIFMMGHSAGAHLVALVATDERYLQAEGLELDVLKGVVPLDTQAYDLSAVIADSESEAIVYRQIFGTNPAGWVQASPDTHISAGKNIPPMAAAYSGGLTGGGDYTRQQATEEFVARLQAAGVDALLVPAPEKTHMQINEEFGLTGDHVTENVMGFIRQIINTTDN